MVARWSSARITLLCVASIAIVSRHCASAADAQCAYLGSDADDIDHADVSSLLHMRLEVAQGGDPRAAPRVATQAKVARKQGAETQAASDVVLTQAAIQVNITGSSLEAWGTASDVVLTQAEVNISGSSLTAWGAEGSSLRTVSGSSLRAWGAEVPTARALHQAAVLLVNAKTKAASSSSLDEMASAVAAAVRDAVKEDAVEAPDAPAFTTRLLAGVEAEDHAASTQVQPEYAPIARMHEGAWDYIASLLKSASIWVASHPTLLTVVPVTLAFLAFAAACLMLVLSTLKSWGSLFYCGSGSSPVAEGLNSLRAERPGPLQPLRVLQLNLSNAGRSQGGGQP